MSTTDTQSVKARDLQTVDRVNAWDSPYLEIQQFLNDEATYLDRDQVEDWLKLLAPDIEYRMPVRVTRRRDEGPGFFDETGHFDDDYDSLAFRVNKYISTASSWSTNPASRTRRFVTNIAVYRTESEGEFAVTSSILVTRTRWDEPKVELISAERDDLVRRTDSTHFQLARRLILVDQSTLTMPNLAIFL